MANTTNIHELPLGGAGENVSFSVNETNQSQTAPTMSLDQTTINQIVSGLQQASVAGATQLPSRDIPRSTEQITHDEQVQPNFIKQSVEEDYIKAHKNTPDVIVEKYIQQEETRNTMDAIYDEIQTPLLLTVLYFLFQLPIFKKNLLYYLPLLFNKDTNINLNGLAFTSIMFGCSYYFLNKTMSKINKL